MRGLISSIDAGGRAVNLEAVYLQFIRGVLVPARSGPQRFAMAAIAISLAAEKLVTAFACIGIEVNARAGLHSGQGKLIKMQRGQFCGYKVRVGIGRDMTQSSLRGDGKLSGVIEPFVEERAGPV